MPQTNAERVRKADPGTAIYRKIRSWDRQSQMGIDLLVLITAFWLAYLLRFEFRLPEAEQRAFFVQLPIVLLAQVLTAYATGIYSFIWRFVGITELRAFFRATLIAPIPLLVLRLGLSAELQTWKAPLSVILMDTVFAFGGMLLVRVGRRLLHERGTARSQARNRSSVERVLILGAGHTGLAIAREIASRGDTGLEAVGFLDDDPAKTGSLIGGTRVLGSIDSLEQFAKSYSADQVILAISAPPREKVRKIMDICDEIPIPLRVVPGLSQILDGSVAISRLRSIEIEDLLGRDPVQLDNKKLEAFLANKRILITGAGGSIGSEVARQVLKFSPSTLLLVERAEFALFDLLRKFEKTGNANARRIVPLVADAGDSARMRAILSTHRPEVIIHAAAHKHVPLMEQNTCEAIQNNIKTTATLARLAGDFECSTFVLISTDKAVRPSSVMGTTKRVAEMLIQEFNRDYSTRFVAVRFGNVLGSTGSVIPIFKDQIANGGPVTVTHPDMVRYFMTIPEASQLVLQAGSYGRGGEILILDMGDPVSIVRLAEDMIRLSGFRPYEDIDITFTGTRPGEKVVEELSVDPTELDRTQHPKIFVSAPLQTGPRVSSLIEELLEFASLGLDQDAREKLAEIVPESTLLIKKPLLQKQPLRPGSVPLSRPPKH